MKNIQQLASYTPFLFGLLFFIGMGVSASLYPLIGMNFVLVAAGITISIVVLSAIRYQKRHREYKKYYNLRFLIRESLETMPRATVKQIWGIPEWALRKIEETSY